MYKRFFIIVGIVLAIPVLGFGCTTESQISDSTIVTTTVQDTSIQTSTESISEAHTIYRIYSVDQKQDVFVMTIASTTMFSGDSATQVAVRETGCTSEDIWSCAGSLNNGFYISKKMSKKFSVSLPIDAPIFILQGADPVKITSEHFYNLYTQTDAFGMGENWTPFIIDIENSAVSRIDQQYIP